MTTFDELKTASDALAAAKVERQIAQAIADAAEQDANAAWDALSVTQAALDEVLASFLATYASNLGSGASDSYLVEVP